MIVRESYTLFDINCVALEVYENSRGKKMDYIKRFKAAMAVGELYKCEFAFSEPVKKPYIIDKHIRPGDDPDVLRAGAEVEIPVEYETLRYETIELKALEVGK
jgi:hypothetical protein